MRSAALILAAFLLSACAGQDTEKQQATHESVQAVQDFIALRGLEVAELG